MDREHVQFHQGIVNILPPLSLFVLWPTFIWQNHYYSPFYLNCAQCYVRTVKEGSHYPSGTVSSTIFMHKIKQSRYRPVMTQRVTGS
jgi:hypothetical protein